MEAFSVLGSTFATPSQSDFNAIAIQCKLLQLEESATAYELPSVLDTTFSSYNITTNLSYFPSDNSVTPEISLEQQSDVNFIMPRAYATKEYSFEKAFEDSEVNITSDFEISNSIPVKKCKSSKPSLGLRKYKISTVREDDFQGAFVSSSDESGISKNNKLHIKLRNNKKPCVQNDFQGAFSSSIDGSGINKNNEYSRESKHSSITNAWEQIFQADFASSAEGSEISKKSKRSKNRSKLNAKNMIFPTSPTSLFESKVGSRNQQGDKTNPILKAALYKTNSKDEEKVSEIISISKLNSAFEDSEDDYQTNSKDEEEEKGKVSEIISLSMINNNSEDSDDVYLSNIASNKSLKSATLIASNNSQVQSGNNHGGNKKKESFQPNTSKSISQLELNSIEPKLDETKLISKPNFEAATISFGYTTINNIDYKEKTVSQIISMSKLNNASEDSEDDYQTNNEEEVSEIISLSKINSSSEDSDDDYLANIVSNISSKSATLITSNISEIQSGSCHGNNNRSFQANVSKSNPQLELNSTYNIEPCRESREFTGALNIDVHSELNGSKNVSLRLRKYSVFLSQNNLLSTNLNNEMSHLMLNTQVFPELKWFTNNMSNSLKSVPPSCRSNVDSVQSVTSLNEFPNQHSEITDETLNFIREIKEINNNNSQQPLKTLKCIEIHSFAQNCPFSELRPKEKKKTTVSENEAISNVVLQKVKIKTAEKVLKPCLPKSKPLSRPKRWVTKRLYNFLFKKLLSNYGNRYRLEAQNLVMFMVEKVTETINKTEDYDVPVEELKMELAKKKIIETNRDFFNFVREFLERDFYLKSVPNSRPTLHKQIIRFIPGTIDDKILQS